MIVDGNVAEVMRKARQRILLHIRVKERTDAAARLLEQLDCVEKVSVTKDQMIEATLKPDVEDYSSLPTELVNARFALTLFREEEVNLETAFLQLTQGLVQ
jgi:ABC-2 type transport system ATP-binding protein